MQVATDKQQTTATKTNQSWVEGHLKSTQTLIINNVDSGLCIKQSMTFQEGVNLLQGGDVLMVQCF